MKLRDHKRKTASLNSTVVLQKMEIDRLTAENERLTLALREYEILYGVPGGKMPVGIIRIKERPCHK